MVRKHQTRNLEIPGSMLCIVPESLEIPGSMLCIVPE
jgi:hypothetical protein